MHLAPPEHMLVGHGQPLHLHVVKQPRAVHPLRDHPQGQRAKLQGVVRFFVHGLPLLPCLQGLSGRWTRAFPGRVCFSRCGNCQTCSILRV